LDRTRIDEAQLAIDIDAFVDRYHGLPLGQLDLASMLLEVTVLLRSIAWPCRRTNMIKVCLTLDGLGRSGSAFDMARQARPSCSAQWPLSTVHARWRDKPRAMADTISLLAALRDLQRFCGRAGRGRPHADG
jgi:ubiquinone biosynthesis protein